MKISGEFFYYLFILKFLMKKHRRGKMMAHPNSQVKGPKLDSALERLLYRRRGNFLIRKSKNFSQTNYQEAFRKNLSGL